MIFSLSLEEREPQTEETGVARHNSQIPKVGKDLDAPGTERRPMWLEQSHRVESERNEMRWRFWQGQVRSYLNYNTTLHGSFFSK